MKYDFSEEAMKFETSNITNPLYGYMRSPNGGGNEYYSTAYLARTGSVLESDEPFSVSEVRSVNKDELNRQGMLSSVPMYIFGLNRSNTYNAEAVDKIKELVMQYGAVGSALFTMKARFISRRRANAIITTAYTMKTSPILTPTTL